MARFDKQIATAERLLGKNGETSTLRRRVDAAPPDPTKPWEPGAPTFTDTDVSAVWLDYEESIVDGSLIERGDQRVLLPGSQASEIDPSTDHIVRASGEKWTIVTVKTLNPNGQVILHGLQVRQ